MTRARVRWSPKYSKAPSLKTNVGKPDGKKGATAPSPAQTQALAQKNMADLEILNKSVNVQGNSTTTELMDKGF